MEGKSELYSEGRWFPRRGGRASKEDLPRRSRSKHEWGSGCKSSATEGLWLECGKVGSQVVSVDCCHLPGRRTVEKVKKRERRGRRTSDRKEKID